MVLWAGRFSKDLNEDMMNELKDEFEYVREMVKGGMPQYQYIYGVCCMIGIYFEKDTKVGYSMLRMCCEKGNDRGEYYLGYCYDCGIGVDKDKAKGIGWAVLAAKNGNESAKELLKKWGFD